MRSCSVCKKPDRPQITNGECKCDGGDILGHQPDCERVEHYVKPEIKYLKSEHEYTPQLKARGWSFTHFQNRPAIQRLTCVECLRSQAQIDKQKAHLAKLSKQAREGSDLNYYQMLCQ